MSTRSVEKESELYDDIDYLHPEGKPIVSDRQKHMDKEERDKPISKKSLDEADGHHMCNDRCKSKHTAQ